MITVKNKIHIKYNKKKKNPNHLFKLLTQTRTRRKKRKEIYSSHDRKEIEHTLQVLFRKRHSKNIFTGRNKLLGISSEGYRYIPI
jgi:hypothetical protein